MIVRIKYFAVFYCCIILLTSYTKRIENFESIPYGNWRIYKYVVGESPSGLSEKEIKGFLGKNIILEKEKVIFINDVCKRPVYKFSIEGNDYFVNNRINKKSLGIKKSSVYIVSLECGTQPKYNSSNSPNFSYEFIVVSGSTLIVNIMGDFFYLKKSIK